MPSTDLLRELFRNRRGRAAQVPPHALQRAASAPEAHRRHTDSAYETELRTLRDRLLHMTAKVQAMLAGAMRALQTRNDTLATHTMASDDQVDQLEIAIDELCFQLLARRQPVASDLRFITTAMKMVTDLERIGDLGASICQRVLELNRGPAQDTTELVAIGATVQTMLGDALNAFVNGDTELAYQVIERDQQVDARCARVFENLLNAVNADRTTSQAAIRLQSVAKHLERIGDHATNLAEMVVFMARGIDIRHHKQPAGAV